MHKAAILAGGGFCLRRASLTWGGISGKDRADELVRYARYHIVRNNWSQPEGDKRSPRRIFYYDCPPPNGRQTTFGKSNPAYRNKTEFLDALAQKTKVAMKDITSNRGTYGQLESADFEIVSASTWDWRIRA